ncbi:tetratricopeptide repeat protein [Tahibacter soli]|uniref:Tetratricopeptide repeat protein n=1 Tax=Tahibacter soli TaxID=2983605 RepID=A0A9X3YSY5_9GAMM|nr:tetratricopeptide repeat protein [Tahibacter soli]MDC8015826.1 tetratricopeptide repeat protein [Tahibacter soli]
MNAPTTLAGKASPWRLLAVLALCALVYWPGLYGAYIFDDFVFFVNNPDVHVKTLVAGDWIRAITSFPAAHQGRWLTMFTLAANYWATGLDPFWLKLTNLAIHLVNGALLYFALRALMRLRNALHGGGDTHLQDAAALAITACWLVLPINLTGVLYAVQRLESLSTLFVLLGLGWYLRARLRLAVENRGIGSMAAALVVCTGLGLLAKESAILLPLYAACVELFVARLHDAQGRWRKPIVGLYAALLVVPLLGGLYWLSTWIATPTTYVRAFTTWQRLMTEARVLVDYMQWTVLPTGKVASLYHDDIAVSTGLLSPPTTLAAIAFLAALGAAALWLRRSRPLLALGIAWFFAAHTLTGTIIPLELVFEHRNYFASCGLLLAVASLLALEPVAPVKPRLLALVAVALFGFYALQTGLRAREWAHPLKLALTEVSNNPRSPRAHYEFARTLIASPTLTANPEFVRRAMEGLSTCSRLPRSGILCEQGQVILAARVQQPIDPAWWQSMLDKLARTPPTESDIGALTELANCQTIGPCAADPTLNQVFDAARAIATRQPRLEMIQAGYIWKMNADGAGAERLIRKAIGEEPTEPAYRAYLIELLVATNQIDAAKAALEELRGLDQLGSLAYMIEPLGRLIELGPDAASSEPQN